jgi:hypothetical protein
MNLLLENTFSTNHYISISDKIKTLPMYFLYFNTIDHVKNLDEDNRKIDDKYRTNEAQREIKYKILSFRESYTHDISPFFQSSKFLKSIFHLFYSANILHENNMSFTMEHSTEVDGSDDDAGYDMGSSPFVLQSNNSCLVLNDYSYSFYFPIVNFRNAKLFFSRSLLKNPYICVDVFLITYLIHNDVVVFTRDELVRVYSLYMKNRCVIDLEVIDKSLHYFIDYNTEKIITYLLQFKYTWTYYSFCYFFIVNYPENLHEVGLYSMFLKYVHSSHKERNVELLTDIHDIFLTDTNIQVN